VATAVVVGASKAKESDREGMRVSFYGLLFFKGGHAGEVNLLHELFFDNERL
jgi:hypothetical protein